MTPHIIRLRGPWQCEALLQNPQDRPISYQVSIPFRVDDVRSKLSNSASAPTADKNALASCRLSRIFHGPTGLDDSMAVQLVIESTGCHGTVWLNAKPIGSLSPKGRILQAEVRDQLQDTNTLAISLAQLTSPSGVETINSVSIALIEP